MSDFHSFIHSLLGFHKIWPAGSLKVIDKHGKVRFDVLYIMDAIFGLFTGFDDLLIDFIEIWGIRVVKVIEYDSKNSLFS